MTEETTVSAGDHMKLLHLLSEYFPKDLDVNTELQYVVPVENPEAESGYDFPVSYTHLTLPTKRIV